MSLSTLQLETPRLLLRLPRHEDLDALATFLADEEATRHIGGPMPRALAWRSLATMRGAWELHGFAMFSVVEKDSGRWVGRVGPWKPEGWPGTEVGWAIARQCWGRGYAPEAAAACIDWAFDTLGWDQVIHTIAPDNFASQAVATRIGSRFLRMGRLPEPHQARPVAIWGQARAQWAARRAAG